MTTAPALRGRSKRYQGVVQQVTHAKAYSPEEAIKLVKGMASAKFDETVEAHIRTAVDTKRTEQTIRGVVVLPHGIGKPRRVVAFVQGEAVAAARQAGADYIADDELVRRIEQEGWADFDLAVATPDMMGRIGRLGRYLGRRGLMPNPRTGTVVPPQDIPRVIQEAKKGRLEFRVDRTAIIHAPIGKVSFSAEQLQDNLAALLDAITKIRIEGLKGQLFRSIYLSSTMGPSAKVDLSKALTMKSE